MHCRSECSYITGYKLPRQRDECSSDYIMFRCSAVFRSENLIMQLKVHSELRDISSPPIYHDGARLLLLANIAVGFLRKNVL